MNKLKQFLIKNYFLILIILFILVTRFFYFLDANVNFVFDQGKDSLAIINIWLNKSPTLIGPWTSIPGLFFGPGWYYLLLPFYILGMGHPVAASIAMTILLCLAVVLFYYSFGKTEAIILACSPIAWAISITAWNPFPMFLLSVIILVLFKKIFKQSKNKYFFYLFFTAALGFHFSTAFAIFYPLIIINVLIFKKVKFNLKKLFLSCLGFLIPFIPQLIFELRNNFLQTKAIYLFLSTKNDQAFNINNLINIFNLSLKEFKLYFIPGLIGQALINKIIEFIFLIFSISSIIRLIKNKKIDKTNLLLLIITILVPIIGFNFLHFNTWYLLALAPVFSLVAASLIKEFPTPIKSLLILLYLLTPISQLRQYYLVDRASMLASNDFLKNKLAAINYIYQQADHQTFSSYHYEPAIYDYAYQYLYFWQALKGKQLPMEFSYKPDEDSYVKEKSELLEYFAAHLPKENKAKKIFFIVEQADSQDELDKWWGQQNYSDIISEQSFGAGIKVYEAIP